VRPAAIRVTGDAAFDQAFQRLDAARARPSASRLPPRVPETVRLIAGSTWPEDEAFLVEAVAQVEGIELVLVPHEPTPEAVERIRERTTRSLGRPPRVLSEFGEAGAPGDGTTHPPIIVDAVGFLAELYLEGDIAYVGGALAGTGLHSVVEPAAAGLPILFGSLHDRWEATDLVAAGAAREVEPGTVRQALTDLMDPAVRREMGGVALGYARSRSGADVAGAELVESLLRA
jgi:3-deoxy-D-manno-octulosonic-acid transferase